MKDIFISYASEEIELAKSVCRLLENNGVSCFIAVRDICVRGVLEGPDIRLRVR